MAKLEVADRLSAEAAIAQGQLTQIRVFGEYFNQKIEELNEKSAGEGGGKKVDLSSVTPADPPADDAKAADVREAVVELVEKFNQLLSALKGE